MAARENQRMLIGLIILVLISLILAVTAYFGIAKATEYADNKEALTKSLALNKNLATAYQTQVQIMKAYIGDLNEQVSEVGVQIDQLSRLANDPNIDDSQKGQITGVIADINNVKDEYEKDMKLFVASEGEDSAEFTWRSLARNLATVVTKKHDDLAIRANEIKRINAEAQSKIASVSSERDELQKTKDDLAVQLKTEQDAHIATQNNLTSAMDKIKVENQKTNDTLDDTREAFTKKIGQYKQKITEVSTENASLKTKVDRYEREVFDIPDGQVVRSSPSIDAVHINLGTFDGLRRNRTFAVYSQDVTNFVEGRHKAMIEVTDVTGAHQAVARITQEDPANPILKGDFVLTATWDPGYAVPIALVGIFDLDNDGSSDLKQLISKIERNGGKVVAYNDDDGNLIGKVDSSTRYLVLGNEPRLGVSTKESTREAIANLIKQGKANSVQQIDLRKLLNWMGEHGQAEIERMDRRMGDKFRQRDPINTLKSDDR